MAQEEFEDEFLMHIMEPMPQVRSSSKSSSTDSSYSSENSEDGISDEDPADVMEMHGHADEDVLFPLMQFLLNGRRRARVENFLDTVHRKSNEEFRAAFRLSRNIVYQLIDQLGESGFVPSHNFGKAKKSAEVTFLVFLWYVSNEEPLRIVAELFDVSEATVFRMIRRVVDWIMTLLDETIKWPQGNNVTTVLNGFHQFAGIRGCIGALDGSHIPIIAPSVPNANDYYNRKRYHSINLTAIVDAERKFTIVFCGDPGSYHDTRVFRHLRFFRPHRNDLTKYFPVTLSLLGMVGTKVLVTFG